MQKEALTFFNTELFTTPYWLLDKTVTDKAGEPTSPNFVEDLQIKVLNTLLDGKQLNSDTGQPAWQFPGPPKEALGAEEYFAIIHQGIWQELHSPKPVTIDPYRRNLQKILCRRS